MQIFHQLVGKDEDSQELLSWGIKHTKHRVVVKRPLKGERLLDPCEASFTGKSTRYDLYLAKKKGPLFGGLLY